MAATTITIDATVRDRLRAFGRGSYNDKLTRLMDVVEKEAFIRELQMAHDDPEQEWETIDWDDPVWD